MAACALKPPKNLTERQAARGFCDFVFCLPKVRKSGLSGKGKAPENLEVLGKVVMILWPRLK